MYVFEYSLFELYWLGATPPFSHIFIILVYYLHNNFHSSALNNQAAHDYATIVNAKLRLEKETLSQLQNDVDDLERQVTTLSYEIAANHAKIKHIL